MINCGSFCVWSYKRPDGNKLVKEWAWASRSPGGGEWQTSQPHSGFASIQDACVDARAKLGPMRTWSYNRGWL